MKFWKSVGQKVKSIFSSNPAQGMLVGATSHLRAPDRRGTLELLRSYKRNPWLRTATYRIASDAAAVPFVLYRAKSAKAKAVGRSAGLVRKSLLEGARVAGELEPVDSHPFLDLLHTMNPALGAASSWTVFHLYQLLKGEAFFILERNALGHVVEAWPVPPHWITETPRVGSPFYRAQYGAWNKLIPEADVWHARQPDPENPYGRGTGLGDALGDELDIDELVGKHVKEWFLNNAKPSAIVALKGGTMDQVDAMEEAWEGKHKGPGKSGQMHFTNAPELVVTELSHTFQEQQLGELRGKQRDTILQVLNVPPECMGIITNSNRATIDAAYFLYSIGVLCPKMDFLVGALQSLLASFGDDSLVLDYLSPVPEDRAFKKETMVALPTNYTVNEHRALSGSPALPGKAGEAMFTPASPLGAFGLGAPAGAADPAWATGEETEPKPAAEDTKAAEVDEAVDPTTALNGAQVTSLVEVINRVATRQLPRDTGIAVINAAFPISMEAATAIMGNVGQDFFVELAPKGGAPAPVPPADATEDEARAYLRAALERRSLHQGGRRSDHERPRSP